MSEQMRIAIQQLAGTYLKDHVSMIPCSVDSVNENDFTVDCTPIGSDSTASLPLVLLNSEANDSFTLIPQVGSTVIVFFSQKNDAYVGMFSQVEKVISRTIGGTLIKQDSGITIKNSAESLKEILSDLVSAIENITVTTPAGASTLPLLNDAQFALITTRINNLFTA